MDSNSLPERRGGGGRGMGWVFYVIRYSLSMKTSNMLLRNTVSLSFSWLPLQIHQRYRTSLEYRTVTTLTLSRSHEPYLRKYTRISVVKCCRTHTRAQRKNTFRVSLCSHTHTHTHTHKNTCTHTHTHPHKHTPTYTPTQGTRDSHPYVWWYQRLCNAILTSWWWAHVLETCRGMK